MESSGLAYIVDAALAITSYRVSTLGEISISIFIELALSPINLISTAIFEKNMIPTGDASRLVTVIKDRELNLCDVADNSEGKERTFMRACNSVNFIQLSRRFLSLFLPSRHL